MSSRPDALGVHRTARVDLAVDDFRAERVVRPLVGIGGDHVVMRHEQHGSSVRSAPFHRSEMP